MKKSLNKFIKGYMEVLYALSSVFYIGFCFCVLVQVISRNFLPNAPSWTEELARYSFIYMVAFGVGLAALKHEFVNVEFLGDFLKSKNQKALDVLNLVIEVIILGKKIVHIQKVRVCHVFDQIGCHSLWRILAVFLSEFLYKLCIHGLNSSLSVNKSSMIQTGRKIKQSGI